jgi:hypothetical protein
LPTEAAPLYVFSRRRDLAFLVAMAPGRVHDTFRMNASSPLSPASSAEAAFEAAGGRGVALVGVLAGFTRRVFGLGRVAAQVVVRLEKEGADPYSTDTGFDIKSAVGLLQRALHLADALRARLRIPAVVAALLRPRAASGHARIARPAADKAGEMPLQLWQISYLRAHEETQAAYREAIAGMSDRDVIEHIYSHLMCASEMLGENREAAGVEALGHQAARQLAAVDERAVSDEGAPDGAVPNEIVADEVLADAMARTRTDVAMADAGQRAAYAPCDGPPPPALERGPPA